MKKYIIITAMLMVAVLSTTGQGTPAYVLTFASVNGIVPVHADSIRIVNLTRGGDTLLYYPDTVLRLGSSTVGQYEPMGGSGGFSVSPCYPNPAPAQTRFRIGLPEGDRVDLVVSDPEGRVVQESMYRLPAGVHEFVFTPGKAGYWLITVKWRGQAGTVKVVPIPGLAGESARLDLSGQAGPRETGMLRPVSAGFPFAEGDRLLFVGYRDSLQSGFSGILAGNALHIFQFAFNIPCPGMPTVTYAGQTYNTVQVFSQCWFRENLNAGTMISGTVNMTNNGILEKYCFNDLENWCNGNSGALYQWDEVMQYSGEEGAQGICPAGWHVPTDLEWSILEGAADSVYGIGDPEWNQTGERGGNAGRALKNDAGWNFYGIGTNWVGFSALPGGMFQGGWSFGITTIGRYWSSTKSDIDHPWIRELRDIKKRSARSDPDPGMGFTVKCLRDQQ